MTLSKLRVVLEASVGGFNRAMRASGRVMGRTLQSAKTLAGGIFSLGNAFKVLLGILAARKLFEVTKAIFDMGAAVGETQAMFSTVFGEGSTKVQAFIDDFATMAGASREAAQEMLGNTGQIVQGLGASQEASAAMSVRVLKLAADWASFKNLRIEDTLLRINAALTGEREGLKRLGLVILETEVQQRAMHENRLTSIKDITQEMKTLASLNIMTEKSGVVLGDLERTQDSAANRAKQLGAEWQNLRNTAAIILLPALVSIMDGVSNSRFSFERLTEILVDNAAQIVGWSAVAISSFGTAFTAMKLGIFSVVVAAAAFMDIITLNWTGTANEMRAVWDKMVADLGRGFTALDRSANDTVAAYERAVKAFQEAAEAARLGLKDIELPIGNVIEQVTRLDKTLVGFTTDFSSRIGRATEDGKAAFDGFFSSVIGGFARLAAELALFSALQHLFPNSSFVRALGGSSGISQGGGGGTLTLPGTGGGTGPPANPSRSRTPGPVFNQTVNFNVAAIDGASVAAVLREQKGTIVAVVAEAAQQTPQLRRVLRGG